MSKDYYLDTAIQAAKEYVMKNHGVDWHGEDRIKYKSIILNDEEFHVFAFLKYGLLITYDKANDDLNIEEIEGVKSGKYSKEALPFIKFCVDRFGNLREFQKEYRTFKTNNSDIKNIEYLNKKFRKEFGIPDQVPIPSDLSNLIDGI